MTKTSSRKRKTDWSDGTDISNRKKPTRENQTPHLPPPVWGHVLDYMPYGEVRSALLVGKEVANDAVKYVKTLNIQKDCELDVPAARRFPHVQELNMLCLLKIEIRARYGLDIMVVIQRAAMSIPHFVCEFSGLKRIYIGGIRPDGDTSPGTKFCYNPLLPCEPENHEDLYRSLIASLLGAYKTRALSQNVTLHDGSLDSIFQIREELCEAAEDSDNGRCEWCRDICRFLPLQHYLFFRDNWICLDDEARNKILRARKGGFECIRNIMSSDVAEELRRRVGGYIVERHTDEEKEFYRNLESLGVTRVHSLVQLIDENRLQEVDTLLAKFGLTPKDTPKAMLYKDFNIGWPGREYDV